MTRWIANIGAALGLLMMAGTGDAQDYPNKPIRIIYSGGSQEVIARIIADAISKPLQQPVVPENRPSVVTAAEAVAQSAPDGYTVLLTGGNFHLTPLLRTTNYDPIKDFDMVTIVGKAPLVLYATPSLNVKSVKELIEVAKARPGELDASVSSLGGGSHLVLEQLNTLAGIKITPIPYSAGSQELSDLLSGRVKITFAPASPYMAQVQAGTLVGLGVTSPTPSPLVPGLPAVAGELPGLERINMTIMAAPKGVPADVMQRLNGEVVKALASKEVQDLFLAAGLEVGGGTPEEADQQLAADIAKLSAQIKALGLELK